MRADWRATDFVVVAGEIAQLIGLLDDDSAEVAEDAKAELFSIGVQVVQPLALPWCRCSGNGQLSVSRDSQLVIRQNTR